MGLPLVETPTAATLRKTTQTVWVVWLEEVPVETSTLPRCQSCNSGDLVPLSDFGGQGAAIHYKAWACTNPDCGFNIKIRNGDIYLNEPISNGSMHVPRAR